MSKQKSYKTFKDLQDEIESTGESLFFKHFLIKQRDKGVHELFNIFDPEHDEFTVNILVDDNIRNTYTTITLNFNYNGSTQSIPGFSKRNPIDPPNFHVGLVNALYNMLDNVSNTGLL